MKIVTIAGGGIAGLSLASALRRHDVPVSVFEAGSYPRHRVCGEFVSGVKEATLDFLGVTDVLDGARIHSTMGWFENGKALLGGTLPEPARGISRYLLDDRLRRRVVEMGGQVTGRSRMVQKPKEGLAWAAGKRTGAGGWLGLKAHVRRLNLQADLEIHSGTNGYVGIAEIEEGWFNVCGLFRRDRSITAKGGDLLTAYVDAGGNHHLAEMLRKSEWRSGSFTAAAGFRLGHQPPVPGLLTLGDAWGMIPPFAGNGMSMAFQAAECACGPLAEWSAGSVSWQKTCTRVQEAQSRRFRRRLAAASLMHPMIMSAHGRALIRHLTRLHLLPFRSMFALVR